jgi:DNA helicase-2/ATP-dependent DNA helicase PcrA
VTAKVGARGDDLLRDLNPMQEEAVRHPGGPLLVLAGAGSGKTRVLTYRIAHLLSGRGVHPRAVLAVTFTNKASEEMRRRVAALVGPDAGLLWVGTFHSISARILRLEARWSTRSSGFSIYDEADQSDVVKRAMEKAGVAGSVFAPKAVLSAISRAKDRLLSPDALRAASSDYFGECVAKVYFEYEQALHAANAYDFDDLIMKTVELLSTHPPVLSAYASRFEHVLVDEYQDTSHAQYALVNLLSSHHQNVCVVGDDDQSIYGWRGADITNILDFEKDHPNATVIRLEQNYRSTKCILDAAHDVVARNVKRKEKKLWTERPRGRKVRVVRASNEHQEADALRDTILAKMSGPGLAYHDFAILYRTHAQSRVIEDSLRRAGIAYDIVGGVRFYERAEVKDVLAYLKVVANPQDVVNLRRIVNVPPRKIGERTLARLEEHALSAGTTLLGAAAAAGSIGGIAPAAARALEELAAMFARASSRAESEPLDALVSGVLESSGYVAWLSRQKSEESSQRLANVEELVSAASEFVEASGGQGLTAFLEQVSLVADIDLWDDRANAVSLMTLHNAKGLEFRVVMIPGLEDGLLPHESSLDDQDELEEERRLFYVGMTRAMDELVLAASDLRRRGGVTDLRAASRFLDEIGPEHIEVESYEDRAAGLRWAGARRAWAGGRRAVAGAGSSRAGVFPDYEGHSQEVPELVPGVRVRHPSWGEGVVVDVSGRGLDAVVRVRFADDAEKRIMVRYGKLELVSGEGEHG